MMEKAKTKEPAHHSSENIENDNNIKAEKLDPILAMVLWTLNNRGKIKTEILSKDSLRTFQALEKEGFVKVGKGEIKLTKKAIEEVIEPIEEARAKGKKAKKGHKIEVLEKFSPVPFADQIINEFGGHIFSDKTGTIWAYSELEGYWIEAELNIMASLRNDYFNDLQQQNHYVNEIISYLRESLYEDGRTEKPDWHFINLANGIFDLEKQKLEPHNSWYFFTNRIELRLDENIKDCPKIHKLFSDWVDEEDIITLYELVAYSLVDNYKYQKMFFIVGKGYNGKGKFAEIIQKTVGQENVIGISLDGLVEREFEKIRLQNKKVNIAGEINLKELKKTDTIKMLTGGDIITARRLYHMGVEFINTCKIIFLTNSPPMTTDKTKGFYRRVFVQEFTRDFEGAEDNPNIIDDLEEEEFQGLLSVCLHKILPALIKRRFKFTQDKSTEKMEEIYERLSNPLSNFIYEQFTENSESFIPIKVFKTLFKTWCQDNGDNIWSDKKLGSTMKNTMGFSVGKKKIKENYREDYNTILGSKFYTKGTEVSQECYLGILLKSQKISDSSDSRGFSQSPLYVGETSSKTSDTSDTSDFGLGRKKQKEEIKNTTSDFVPDKQKENPNSNGEKQKEENNNAKKIVSKILQGLNIIPGDHGREDAKHLIIMCNKAGLTTAEAIEAIEAIGGIETEPHGTNTVYDFSDSVGEASS